MALNAAEDIRALKAKLLQTVERTRIEKENRIKAEQESKSAFKKIDMLSDHVEKLMIHLKHEAAAKIRVQEQLRNSEREFAKLKEKYDLLMRKNAAKDRLILELREGSKILEDQLRLMDEKYLELRTKLEYAREQGAKKIKKAETTAKTLRMKFALSTNSTMMLDQVPLPDIHHSHSSQSIGSAGGNVIGFNDNSMMDIGYNSYQSGAMTAPSNYNRSNKYNKKHGLSKTSKSVDKLLVDEEPSLDSVLDKIRKHQGVSVDWTEEKIRNLTNK